jgi:predicted dehydrogenase
MDLGVHLLDLAFWTLGCTHAEVLASSLFGTDGPLKTSARQVEDLAYATLRVREDVVVRLACSWRMHAGRDAVIEVSFYGTSGGLSLRNVNGSFYDFRAERYNGTQSELLAEPPDAWGGRAAAAWAKKLSQTNRYDPQANGLLPVAQALDEIYSKAGRSALVREEVQQASEICMTKSGPGASGPVWSS